jgi:hypothetical protein
VVPQGFGVNIHFTEASPPEAARLGEPGFGVVRMDFTWQRVEATPGVYDFSAYDNLTALLAADHIRPLYILDYDNTNYDGGLSPHTDGGRAAYARFAGAAAAHFRGRGVIWEIRNEPNLAIFWKPKPNAVDYAELAVAVAAAVRKADPGACVLGPCSSGFDWDFLRTTFQQGLLGAVDAVSVHPYRATAPETADADYTKLRQLIAAYTPAGQPQRPIVCSEWGYSTAWGGMSADLQGSYLVREWLANLADGVDLSIYYDWKNDGTNPADGESNFGTVASDLTPKSAFLTAKALIGTLDGFRFAHRLLAATDTEERLLFLKGDRVATVTWSSDGGASVADQTPAVSVVTAGQPAYDDLRHAADIAYTTQVLVPTVNGPASLVVTVANSDVRRASVVLVVGFQKRMLELKAGASRRFAFPIRLQDVPPDGGTIPVSATWNGGVVNGLPPVRIAVPAP